MAAMSDSRAATASPSTEVAVPTDATSRYARVGTRVPGSIAFRQIVAEYAIRKAQAGMPSTSSVPDTESDTRKRMTVIAVASTVRARTSIEAWQLRPHPRQMVDDPRAHIRSHSRSGRGSALPLLG